jgi:preprotein translocase subunit SecE
VNRQTKRQMARQGMDSTGTRAPAGGSGGRGGAGTGGRGGGGGGRGRGPAAQPDRERTGPRQYLTEVRAEMRKVAWPTRAEIINSSLIVLIAVVVMTSLIFVFDYGSAKIVLFLFD